MKSNISALLFIFFMTLNANMFSQQFSLSNIRDLNLKLALRIYGNIDFTQVSNLALNSSQISDIKPLGKLSQLQRLELYNNRISEVKPLENLVNLTQLFLGRNKITNITALSNMINLQTLDIQKNRIFDISPLQNLTKIKELNLRGTPAYVSNFGDWKFSDTLEIYDFNGNWKEISADDKTNWSMQNGILFPVQVK